MKQLFFLFWCSVVFQGCSQNTAFDRFTMTQQQKFAENSIQSSKVTYKDEIDGTLNVVYLNEVNKEQYNDKEYFYVYLYLKDKHPDILFLLNNTPAIHVTQLGAHNQFSNLISFDAPWNKFYLVEFKKQGDKLNFQLQNKHYKSRVLHFEKDQ